MSKVNTYNVKLVTVALGSHIATGLADDTVVTVEPNGDGITKVVGCDGEVTRSIDPDSTYNIKLSVNQSSSTNKFLQNAYDKDRDTGDGMFPCLITDKKGRTKFSAENCWVSKPPALTYEKASGKREWELQTGEGVFSE